MIENKVKNASRSISPFASIGDCLSKKYFIIKCCTHISQKGTDSQQSKEIRGG